MEKSLFGPKQLLSILVSSLVILFIGIAVGLTFIQAELNSQSKNIASEVAGLNNTKLTPQSQATLQRELDSKKPIIAKIDALFATASNYQSTALSDIGTYASKSGIKISSTSFTALDTSIAGSKSVTVTINDNVKFDSLIKFLSYIEKTTPKMQVTNLKIDRSDSVTSSEVKVEKLIIAIYVR